MNTITNIPTTLSIKVSKGDDIRRFKLDATVDPNPFENLMTQLCNLYTLNIQDFNPGASFRLVYKDDMNSDITISSSEELGYALIYSVHKDPLALYVISLRHERKDEPFIMFDNKAEKWKIKKEKHLHKQKERRDKRFSNGKIYGSLDIYDPEEIELYKGVLIELDESGYKSFKNNLKILKQYRHGNDFTEAKNKIKEFKEFKERNRKRKLERENCPKKLKEKKSRSIEYPEIKNDELVKENDRDNANIEDDDEDESGKHGEGEEEVAALNPEFTVLTNWPENITHLYIDGNNLLYIAKNIRNMTIRRKGNKAQDILIGSFELFSSLVKGLESVFIIFDKTRSVYEKTVGVNTRFTIRSARPQFNTSDDALVSEAEKIPMIDRSLFVTSDRGLCTRLQVLGTKVVRPKNFFNIFLSFIYGPSHNTNLDDFFLDIEKKLDLDQINQ